MRKAATPYMTGKHTSNSLMTRSQTKSVKKQHYTFENFKDHSATSILQQSLKPVYKKNITCHFLTTESLKQNAHLAECTFKS